MSLRPVLARLQSRVARFYLQLAEHFSQNTLMRDTWVAMAQDVEQQASSLKGLRPAFWKQLKKEENALLTASKEADSLLRLEPGSQLSEWSLQPYFHHTLEFEEPIILKLYAPLVHRLRGQGTADALNFYIMVNAHVTRLTRLIQSFSGEPTLVQQCMSLLQRFEKASQGPEPVRAVPPKKRAKKPIRHAALRRAALRGAKVPLRLRKRVKRTRPLVKRTKTITKRAKPLVKNLNIRGTRARR